MLLNSVTEAMSVIWPLKPDSILLNITLILPVHSQKGVHVKFMLLILICCSRAIETNAVFMTMDHRKSWLQCTNRYNGISLSNFRCHLITYLGKVAHNR